MKRRTVSILGFIIAALFLVAAFIIKVPNKYISYYSSMDDGYVEYVGGDAYNYIIEAALRGGEIAGAKTSKAIFFASAGIITVISLFGLVDQQPAFTEKPKLTEPIKEDGQQDDELPDL